MAGTAVDGRLDPLSERHRQSQGALQIAGFTAGQVHHLRISAATAVKFSLTKSNHSDLRKAIDLGSITMSQAAAVQAAVWAQLAAELKPLPTTGQEVMGTGYGYNFTTMRGFLYGVSLRLAADKPSINFPWTTMDANACLADTVLVLCGAISAAIP